jgi:DtxR family transcriptional regulator, Mn-dependent transcriptional regulator
LKYTLDYILPNKKIFLDLSKHKEMPFSASEENHIKGIYHLQQAGGSVTTNALAAHLQTKAASVTDMLKKLDAKKLLHYQPYKGFSLTERGTKAALMIVRRHRLWEYFLAEKLGFDWHKVHAIAEELEHVGGDELIERLGNFLGNPLTDPHGDPIPDRHGKLPVIAQANLTELPLNKPLTVSAVSNQSPDMLEMLGHYGISIGSRIRVKKHFAFDGSLEIIVNKQAFVISGQAAKNILVHYAG